MQKNQAWGEGMLQAVTNFYSVPGFLLVNLSPYLWHIMTPDNHIIIIFLHFI